ncbi:MAG: hypothetical protein ACLUB2_06580 [Butyricicoccus pullicaecorum]
MNDQIVSGFGMAIRRSVTTTTIDNRMSAPNAKITVTAQDKAGKAVAVKEASTATQYVLSD